MTNDEFWSSIRDIINNDFEPKGIDKLEKYAELFSKGELIFKRFSSQEQHGCAAGGSSHVIASILAGAETAADQPDEKISDIKREFQRGALQAELIEHWAHKVGCWIPDVDMSLASAFGDKLAEGGEAKVYDNGSTLIKSIGLDYYILPSLALDRISLHNAFFPETKLTVIGFGRDTNQEFKIIVEQTYIEGSPLTEQEIDEFATSLGFELRNRRNWTYTTPFIYLSDLHDENLIKSESGSIYVIDCDIRLNTPDLRLGGIREYSHDVEFIHSNRS